MSGNQLALGEGRGGRAEGGCAVTWGDKPLIDVDPIGSGALVWVRCDDGSVLCLESDAAEDAYDVRDIIQRAIARAYWRGMLGGMAADAERESERAPKESFTWRSWRARAARLRAIADGPMWEPWWERKVVQVGLPRTRPARSATVGPEA